MKTALQEAFSKLEELHPELFNVYSPGGRDFINEFHKYLEIEKEQIQNAWKHGKMMGNSQLDFSEEYYNKTFKNTKDE